MKRLPVIDRSPWLTHRTELQYDNPWIRVSESQVTTPTGTAGIYGVVHFKNHSVGVIPVDDEGHTWLVGQYRYSLNSYEWEIPAGGCPESESLEQTAHRELREETGVIAGRLTPLLTNMQLSNSITDELSTIFLAEDLSFGDSAPEATEDLRVLKLPLDQAIERVLGGEIRDANSVAGLLRLAVEHSKSPSSA